MLRVKEAIKNNIPEILLVFSIVIFISFLTSRVLDFKELPSPLFGGDYYYQLGQIYHMYYSSFLEWFGPSNGLGKRPGYLPVYGMFVTLFGKLLSLNPFKAMLFSNFIVFPLSFYLFYLVGFKLGNNKFIGLGTALFASLFFPPFVFKYTEFTQLIMVPFFLLALFHFYFERSVKSGLILGISGGLLLISHVTSIIFVFSSLACLFILLEKENLLSLHAFKKEYIAVLLTTFLIGLIYWFEPLFVYHGVSGLKSNEWSLPDYSNLDVAIERAVSLFEDYFISADSITSFIRSFAFLAGLYFVWKMRKEKSIMFLSCLFLLTAALTFSYIVTTPLFDFNIAPSYLSRLYLSPLIAVIGGFSLKDKKLLALILVLFLLNVADLKQEVENSKYIQNAYVEIPQVYKSLQSYILANTSINDVFISTNELSFMINALTGRKLVVSRRAQNDAFMQDFDDRELDAMIFFYGNDLSRKIDIIKKYNISYVYVDTEWPHTSFLFNDKGLSSYVDPFLVFWSPQRESLLRQYGVKYVVAMWFVDPDVRGDNVRKYKLIIESPDNLDATGLGPWRDDIDFLLEEVWSYSMNGVKVAALYKVRKDLVE